MNEKVFNAIQLLGKHQFAEGEALLRECIAEPLPKGAELSRVIPLVFLGDILVEFHRMDEAKPLLEQAISHREQYKDSPFEDAMMNDLVQRTVAQANFLLTKFYA